MGKFIGSMGLQLLLLPVLLLACLATLASGANEHDEQAPLQKEELKTIKSEEEFYLKLNEAGRLEPDEVEALLKRIDSGADVELDEVESDVLLGLSRISLRNCDYAELEFRQQICRNFPAHLDAHLNLRRFCKDRFKRQFELCQSHLEQLFSEALADLSALDKKLVLEFKQQLETSDQSIDFFGQVAEAHRKFKGAYEEAQVERSCSHVLSRLQIVQALASARGISEQRQLAEWLAIKDLCAIYVIKHSPSAKLRLGRQSQRHLVQSLH